MTNDDLREKAREVAHQMFEKIYWHFPDMNDEGEAMDYNIILSGIAAALREERERCAKVEQSLWECARELEYVQCVENCHSGLCATSLGKELVNRAVTLLGVDFRCDTYQEAIRSQKG